MAPPRKHGRRNTGRRHLVDVSATTLPAHDDAAWSPAAPSVATEEPDHADDGRVYSGQGRVSVELEPDEYAEYRRLLDAGAPEDTEAPATEPEEPAGGQTLESFVDELKPHPETATDQEAQQGGQPVDSFLDAFRTGPGRRSPAAAGSGQVGSAALDGVAPTTRPQSGRPRGRIAALGVIALLALCFAAYLVLQPRSAPLSHTGSSPVRDSSSLADIQGFASTLGAVDRAAGNVVRAAADQEQATLAKAKAARIAHRQKLARQKRRRERARAAAQRSRHQTVTNTASPTPAANPSSTATDSTTTSPTRSTPTTTSSGSSTATHRHAFGDGGVLGAGHAG